MAEKKSNIVTLPSSNRYKWLDMRHLGKGDSKKCDELYIKKGDDFDPLHILCLRLIGNLEKYDDLTFLDVFPKSTCKYLNLWIYEHLSSIYSNMNEADASSTIQKIIPIWTKFNSKNNCPMEFISFIGYSQYYKKMKELYDYALNYKYLLLGIDKDKLKCTTEENAYIEESITLYDEVKRDCSTNRSEKDYCVVIDDIHEAYSKGELSTLKCHEIKESLSDLSEETDFVPGIGGIGSASTQSSSDNVVVGIFPVLGIPLISFVLYKFTPFGTWFKDRLQRNKIFEHNIHEDSSHELSENGFLHSNDESESFMNHIGYLPSDIN
ncbi:Plasmodium vivax Vir protein, putative [Plasmodium ovale]|uniref:Plasmodium vivax Vir protein, putative n=1 Tax=Plasmodium ovale TaxID=36330 RepID=A0A1C3KI98_PLAOA|nr:Plasmodium vivax Vir protein, putative [Plasmodium ovale]